MLPHDDPAASGLRQIQGLAAGDVQAVGGIVLAKAHLRALQWMEEPGAAACEVFNIGTGKGNSVLEVIQAFKEATATPVPYVIGPRRAGDATAVYADTAKSRDVLRWAPTLTLHDALRDAWRWQQGLSHQKIG